MISIQKTFYIKYNIKCIGLINNIILLLWNKKNRLDTIESVYKSTLYIIIK